MLDITVVILTKDEELHIGRCLERLKPLQARRVVVVDCFSTDRTVEIARGMGAEVVQREWPGCQAVQFNWALDNLDIDAEWVLRLDADEYLLPELVEEIRAELPRIPQEVNGVTLRRRHIFMGRWMRRGVYPVKLLRLFRYGKARSEQRLMDEHISLHEGRAVELKNDFCDHNLNNLSWFCQKHINYAVREAAEMLLADFPEGQEANAISGHNAEGAALSRQAAEKRRLKGRYARMPLFWRSAAYFLYRYVARGAFLEGKEGFLFSFIQGWWYRTLVDAKVLEIKRKSGGNPAEIRRILREEYNVKI